jgi:hypothetical protein
MLPPVDMNERAIIFIFLKRYCTLTLSPTAPHCPEEVRPAQPEDALCLWPVLEKRAAERGRQEQEVLLR